MSLRYRPTLMNLEDRTVPANVGLDSDGDGLPDAWEINGIDFNGDGVVDFDLKAHGANPNHKDVFVELDAMLGRAPEVGNLQRVVRAFDNSPLTNPDGQTGITLHVEFDELDLKLTDWPTLDNGFPRGAFLTHDLHFGTPAERDDPNAANVLGAKDLIYRYCIFANGYGDNTSSGVAITPGTIFAVTLGHFVNAGGSADEQVGSFMHELGHTFGLRHGGNVDTTNIDNYLSVMNYKFEHNGRNKLPNFPDYSGANDGHYFDWANLNFNPRKAQFPLRAEATPDAETPTVERFPVIGQTVFAVAPDKGSGPVRVYDHNGAILFTLDAYDAAFTGGIRVATADVNGDGIQDVITAPGPGISAEVKAFSGADKSLLFSFFAFEHSFTGGFYVAAADFNHDGYADIAVSPDEGGGPRVRVLSGRDQSQLMDFLGIDDKNFRGGARIGVGDINGDGVADLFVGAGFGGGPRLAIYDGTTIGTGNVKKVIPDFFVFEDGLRNGVFVTAGDIDGDGFADLIAGGGPGGGPRVFVLRGDLIVNKGVKAAFDLPVANFFAGDPDSRGGVHVAAHTLGNFIYRTDLIVGSGEGSAPRVVAYSADRINGTAPKKLLDFAAFKEPVLGVHVG